MSTEQWRKAKQLTARKKHALARVTLQENKITSNREVTFQITEILFVLAEQHCQ